MRLSLDSPATTEKDNPPPQPVPPRIWIFTTYFAEGLPYAIIRTVSSVFFRDNGASLEAIGLTSFFGIPWALKFLWAPAIDQRGSKRQWLIPLQVLLAGIMLTAAALTYLPHATTYIAIIFFLGSFLAATHDIAIDGFYLETLDASNQARFVGYRVMAYRIAMMAGTGIIATIGATVSWPLAFAISALAMMLLSAFHLRYLPHRESPVSILALLPSYKASSILILVATLAGCLLIWRFLPTSMGWHSLRHQLDFFAKIDLTASISLLLLIMLTAIFLQRRKIMNWLRGKNDTAFGEAMLSFLDRDKIAPILAFIVLIKTGEYMLSCMAAPFMIDLGIKQHYGWISGGIGLPFSIGGAMVGGWLISRYSLKKMTLPLLLAQNITILGYMFLALSLNDLVLINTGNPNPVSIGWTNLFAVVCVHAFEHFAGGLGTSVLMIFLMHLCHPRFKAAHYAIGTGLMSISGLCAGVLSGYLAAWAGYGYFFGISFLLSLPGMALIFFVPLSDQQKMS